MGLFAQMLRKLVKHIQQRREDDASRQLEASDSRVAKVSKLPGGSGCQEGSVMVVKHA